MNEKEFFNLLNIKHPKGFTDRYDLWMIHLEEKAEYFGIEPKILMLILMETPTELIWSEFSKFISYHFLFKERQD